MPKAATAPRLRIYALMGERARLEPTSQAQIDEARFLSALSTFADVYYNGQKFDPDAADWGLDATVIGPPAEGYDLYYVNDNPPVFLSCPSPRITRAAPYDAGVFHAADAILAPTRAWKDGLEALSAGRAAPAELKQRYRDLAGVLPRVIALPPAIDPVSRRSPAPREVTAAKAVMSFGQIIGYFGPGREPVAPSIFLSAYREVRRFLPDLQMALGGGLQMERPDQVLVLPAAPHAALPAYVKACLAVVADEGPQTELDASARIADALSVGTPVIALRTAAHIEQLGADYPLFYTDQASAAKRLLQLTFDPTLAATVADHIARLAQGVTPEAVGAALQAELEGLIERKAAA